LLAVAPASWQASAGRERAKRSTALFGHPIGGYDVKKTSIGTYSEARRVWSAVGITEVEERVYRSLLHEPALSPTDCARALDISPQRCRLAINRLAELGLLASGTAPGRSRPVDPRVAVGALIRQRQGELDKLSVDVDQLATDFYHGRLRADPNLVIDVVEGREAIAGRFRDLLSIAQRDVVSLNAPPYVMDPDECEALELAALGRGARVRSMYNVEVLNDSEMLAYLAAMARAGEQARFLRTVPLKLYVVDGAEAILPLTGHEAGSRFRAIVVRRSALTDALRALFEVLWRQAPAWTAPDGITGVPPRPGTGLTEEERSLLRYLVSGMKDEAIARHVGCSRRTLRRRVDALLDRLGAANRFQAGVLAVQRGWL
jgi:DNA-binding NarL/FixJ family response regulator